MNSATQRVHLPRSRVRLSASEALTRSPRVGAGGRMSPSLGSAGAKRSHPQSCARNPTNPASAKLRAAQIRAQLRELAPVMAEYERLQAAYAALDSAGAASGDRRSAAAGTRGRPKCGAGRARARSASRRSRPRARRGQNKAAVLGVIAERPSVTVNEIAQVTGIAKALITTRRGQASSAARSTRWRCSTARTVSGWRRRRWRARRPLVARKPSAAPRPPPTELG